jgi:hypothetical protein
MMSRHGVPEYRFSINEYNKYLKSVTYFDFWHEDMNEGRFAINVNGKDYIAFVYDSPGARTFVQFDSHDAREDLGMPDGSRQLEFANFPDWISYVNECVTVACSYRKEMYAARKIQRVWRRWRYTRACYDPSRPANRKRMRAEVAND